MSNYIYLLQEREFMKTNENVYKIGMTKKANHERFNQYPKGSILLFQMICNDCKNMEKIIIIKFKQHFKLRKDIGNEYFEGDYKNMVDIIYSTIKNENEECVNFHEKNDNMIVEEAEEEEEPIYQITTYEEWIKHNKICEIIITNKKNGEGYLRCKGNLWRELCDKNRFDFDENSMEYLSLFIEKIQPSTWKMVSPTDDLIDLVSFIHFNDMNYEYKNTTTNKIINNEEYKKLSDTDKQQYDSLPKNDKYKFIHAEYDNDKIMQDIIEKCHVKKCDFYNLNYHEYVLSITNNSLIEHFIFNSVNFTLKSVDDALNNKILTGKDCGSGLMCFTNVDNIDMVNIDVVDDILDSLIGNEIKVQYKKLAHNLIVKQEEKQIIFYDYNGCLLTTWIRDLLYFISNSKFYVISEDYYENKSEFKKLLKTQKYRVVIITEYKNISIKTQINDFCKLGFKNIIVCQTDKANSVYDIVKYRNYLQDNKELLMKCMKEQQNYEVVTDWNNAIQYNDSIFYSNRLLLVNFFKWCCVA